MKSISTIKIKDKEMRDRVYGSSVKWVLVRDKKTKLWEMKPSKQKKENK